MIKNEQILETKRRDLGATREHSKTIFEED